MFSLCYSREVQWVGRRSQAFAVLYMFPSAVRNGYILLTVVCQMFLSSTPLSSAIFQIICLMDYLSWSISCIMSAVGTLAESRVALQRLQVLSRAFGIMCIAVLIS